MSAEVTRVFVYGTLLRGEPNHRVLSGARWVGEARTEAAYELLDLGAFPAMVEGGRTAIAGEVYLVDEAIVRRLDHLEGHPDFYTRKAIRLDSGEPVVAYVLRARPAFYLGSISSGDWRAR